MAIGALPMFPMLPMEFPMLFAIWAAAGDARAPIKASPAISCKVFMAFYPLFRVLLFSEKRSLRSEAMIIICSADPTKLTTSVA